MASLFSDFLTALGVPHTTAYADGTFSSMPFKSLFGLSRKLKDYGVETVAVEWPDKSRLTSIPAPFLAQTPSGFVIVKDIAPDGTLSLSCAHKGEYRIPAADFEQRWTGLTLLAYPCDGACEPHLGTHRFNDFVVIAKKWVLIACAVILLFAALAASHLYARLSTIALLLVDFAGLGVTWLLLLKSLSVSSRSAERICGILQEHGCDTVLKQKASSFFGIFSWSEVGISYFGISTLVLLIWPGTIGWLALINACCLPFTFWSIWYQHYRIHAWCTLCVTTQCLLWLQFGAYLWAGAWHSAFPLTAWIVPLLAAYGAALLGINRVTTFIKRRSGALTSTVSDLQ